jgi:hypothetical protein
LQVGADGSVQGVCDRMEIRRSTDQQSFACSGDRDIVLFTR